MDLVEVNQSGVTKSSTASSESSSEVIFFLPLHSCEGDDSQLILTFLFAFLVER